MTKIICDKCDEEKKPGAKMYRVNVVEDKETHFCHSCYRKLLDWIQERP